MRPAEVVGEGYAQITEMSNQLNWNVFDAVLVYMKEQSVEHEQNVVPCTYLC